MGINVELEAREDVPRWLTYTTPVFTVVAALLVSAVPLLVAGVNPITAYDVMFIGTLTSSFGLTETAIQAIPLILTGLAVYLPLKAGLWNVGAEGQLFAGAIVGTWIGVNVSLPQYALLPAMFVGAAVAGALWAGVPAWLRAKWGINEIVTTLLLIFVATGLKNYLVRGPMQGGAGDFPQSEALPTAARLPSLFGTNVHAGLAVAILATVGVFLLMTETRLGFEISLVGSNDEAAEQAGINVFKAYLLVFIIGGALAAMAGISDIAGVQGRLREGFAPDYGFTAIPIALLGRNGAFRVLMAAAFFSLLFVGSSSRC